MSTWKTVAPPELTKSDADSTRQVKARHKRTVRKFFHSPVSGTLSISSITLTARIAEAENSIMIYRVTKSDI